jgi:hypothetical protein
MDAATHPFRLSATWTVPSAASVWSGTPWLSEHQYMLEVVLDDCSGLIWLAVISRRAATGLIRAITDLVPKNRRQCVEAGVPRANHDVCRQRENPVPAILSAWH